MRAAPLDIEQEGVTARAGEPISIQDPNQPNRLVASSSSSSSSSHPPSSPQYRKCIAKFMGFFIKEKAKAPPAPKSYAEAVRSVALRSDMVYPAANRGGGWRDGFGGGRMGHGAGRTEARGAVWQ